MCRSAGRDWLLVSRPFRALTSPASWLPANKGRCTAHSSMESACRHECCIGLGGSSRTSLDPGPVWVRVLSRGGWQVVWDVAIWGGYKVRGTGLQTLM